MCRVNPFWGISFRGTTIVICSANLFWNVCCFILIIIAIKKAEISALERLHKLEKISTRYTTEKVQNETTDLPTPRSTPIRPLFLSDIQNGKMDYKTFMEGLKRDPYYDGGFGLKDNASAQEYLSWFYDFRPTGVSTEEYIQTEEEREKESELKVKKYQSISDLIFQYSSWKIWAILLACVSLSGLPLSTIIFWGLYKYKPKLILLYLILFIISLIMDSFLGVFVLCMSVMSDKSWNIWETKHDGWIGILLLVSVVLRSIFSIWTWSYYKELQAILKQETYQHT